MHHVHGRMHMHACMHARAGRAAGLSLRNTYYSDDIVWVPEGQQMAIPVDTVYGAQHSMQVVSYGSRPCEAW